MATNTIESTSTPTNAEPQPVPESSESDNSGEATNATEKEEEAKEEKTTYSWRFWIIFPALCITAFLSSLEGTIVTTALPSINQELNTGENYVWVINAFFLTSAAFQPLYGQLADIFGRRWVMATAVSIFILGSGIGGGATSTGMLIAGRSVQGAGSGGMVMMLDLIVSDLVPVQKRGSFMGIIFAAVNVGTALGPFVGGIIVQTISWRWAFYLNLPIGGLCLLVILLVLNTSYRKDLVKQRLLQIDVVGNIILVAATVSILFALTYGGARYSWSSWHVLVPLLLGFAGYGLFILFEASKYPSRPVVPLRLFSHRTSATAYFITFIWSILSMWRIYFLSVYFQGVKGSSPARAGVQILPSVLVLLPAVTISGAFMKKTGKFLPIHYASFSMLTVGQGLYTILGPHSSTATWVILQLFLGFFANLVLPCLLPAIQAGLSETDTAAATAFFGFIRSFGIIWGVTIPAAIFNNRFDALAGRIQDADVRAELTHGKAYEHASKQFLNTLSAQTRTQVVSVYSDALKRAWQVSIVFAGVAFLAVFLERQVKMRTTLETEYGLKKKEKKDSDGVLEAGENTAAGENGEVKGSESALASGGKIAP
ncbi:MFS general substrate transporter [Acephala macrosclerotiorum]|nr:MFS general substrate transporter [Acephala macrosclerotiorum]